MTWQSCQVVSFPCGNNLEWNATDTTSLALMSLVTVTQPLMLTVRGTPDPSSVGGRAGNPDYSERLQEAILTLATGGIDLSPPDEEHSTVSLWACRVMSSGTVLIPSRRALKNAENTEAYSTNAVAPIWGLS